MASSKFADQTYLYEIIIICELYADVLYGYCYWCWIIFYINWAPTISRALF